MAFADDSEDSGARGSMARRPYRHLGSLLLTSTVLCADVLLPSALQAQQPRASAQQRAVSFSIPAQPLPAAINAFIGATGWQVGYSSRIADGITSQAVSGAMPPARALQTLLAGTGISMRLTGPTTATLVGRETSGAAAVAGAISLDTINVQGDDQSPTGPGVGYVATRSLSGTKTDTPILETPQSISVVTRQQMDDQAVQTVAQALHYTAGINSTLLEAHQGVRDTDLLLRGFQPDQYLDGLKLAPGVLLASQIDPYFLNRIEVLHGPSSVLYGQGLPGGILTMSSKLPTEQPYHEVMIQGGSYDHLNGDFDLGGPIDKDGQFLYRLTGVGLTSGSQVDFSHSARIGIAPAITWRPDANTTLTVLGQYQHDFGPIYYGSNPAQGTVLFNPNGKIPTSFLAGDPNFDNFDRTQSQIGYMFEHRFDDTWTVRQNFRYQNIGVTSDNIYGLGFEPDLATLNRYAFHDAERLNAVTVDNQVQAKFLTGPFSHTAIAGLDYQWNGLNQSGWTAFNAPSINVFNPVYYQTIPGPGPGDFFGSYETQYQVGAYAQDQVKLDRLSIILGGREDWAGVNTRDNIAGSDVVQSNKAFTYRAGAIYAFDNGVAPYVSYATSFSPTIGTNFSGQAFVPTTGQQYEVGIKYQPPGWDSFITASAYNLTEQNVLVTDPDHPLFQTQTGEIRARGFEIEGHANLTESLKLIASYSYIDAVNTKSDTTDTTIDGITESTRGKRPVGIPSEMASLWADYTFSGGPANGFGFAGGVRYVGSSPGDDVNSFYVPPVTLFDAAIHYDLGKANPALQGFKLQLNATNLLDKTFVTSCNGETFCTYGLRRTILATLKYQW